MVTAGVGYFYRKEIQEFVVKKIMKKVGAPLPEDEIPVAELGAIHANPMHMGAIHANPAHMGAIHANPMHMGAIEMGAIEMGALHTNPAHMGALHKNPHCMNGYGDGGAYMIGANTEALGPKMAPNIQSTQPLGQLF